MKPSRIVGLPDDEEDLFAFLDDPQPKPVSHPGNPSRAARIERAGFCQACATACADGEAVGFRDVPLVCDSCRAGWSR